VKIVMVGLNHRTAPVEVREALAVSGADAPTALTRLRGLPVSEGVLLSTCNRTEVYAVGRDVAECERALVDYLTGLAADLHGRALSRDALEPFLYRRQGLAAVEHLFRVAAGLDSMILGETQILGQVRTAHRQAAQAQTVGKVMHQLFHQAIAVGKRAQTETRIGQSAVSVSYAAVELARKVFQTLEGRRCLAIGAGETAKLTVRHLQAAGVRDLVVANRTLDRAERLAREINGRAITLDEVPRVLSEVDVVISSTGAPGYVVTRQQVEQAVRARRGRPIFLFDIAVPRDIEPGVAHVEGAFLYDIDDLEAVVTANLAERQQEARKVERIIAEEVERFRQWAASLAVVPTIRMLREKVDAIREQELARAFNRLPDLTERQREVIAAMTVSLVNKILNAPTQQLKGMAGEGAADEAIQTVSRLFDLGRPAGQPAVEGGGSG